MPDPITSVRPSPLMSVPPPIDIGPTYFEPYPPTQSVGPPTNPRSRLPPYTRRAPIVDIVFGAGLPAAAPTRGSLGGAMESASLTAPTSRSGSPSPLMSTMERVGVSDEQWVAGPGTSTSHTPLAIVPCEPPASPLRRQNQMPASRSSGTTSSLPLAVKRFTSPAK